MKGLFTQTRGSGLHCCNPTPYALPVSTSPVGQDKEPILFTLLGEKQRAIRCMIISFDMNMIAEHVIKDMRHTMIKPHKHMACGGSLMGEHDASRRLFFQQFALASQMKR